MNLARSYYIYEMKKLRRIQYNVVIIKLFYGNRRLLKNNYRQLHDIYNDIILHLKASVNELLKEPNKEKIIHKKILICASIVE